MPFSYGDVVLVLFPDSNLRTAKRRPALVIMPDTLNTGLPPLALVTVKADEFGILRGGHDPGT